MRSHRLIGRDAQLTQLKKSLLDAGAGEGSAHFLTGEPGIGKTRLAREVGARALASGMTVLRGRGSAAGPDVPFRVLTEALFSFARNAPSELVDGLGPYRPILAQLVPDWGPDRSGDALTSLVALAEAVLRLGTVAGAQRGCLLYLDDLHDADAETLAVVEYLTGNLIGVPLVLLATLRTGTGPAHELVGRAARAGEASVIPLPSFTSSEVDAMVGSCLDCAPDEIPGSLTTLLLHHGGGVPLVIEELLHDLVADGDLVRGDRGWQLSEHSGTVPLALVDVIGRRADLLGAEGSRLITTAAVIGERFPIPLLRQATRTDDRTLQSHLRAAHALDLVTPDVLDPDWYVFRHRLTVDALLAKLGTAEEAVHAGQVADAVTDLHPGLPGEWCQLAAQLRLRQGNRLEAGRLYLRAGRRALRDGASGSAAVLLEEAHRQLQVHGGNEERADALQALLVSLAETGQVERAGELAAALRGSSGTRDATGHIEVLARLAWAANMAGRYGEVRRHVETARALLPERPTDRQLALVETIDAYATMFGPGKDQLPDGEETARRAALRAEELEEAYTASQAWYALGLAARKRSLAESDACFERILALAEQHDLMTWRTYGLTGLAGNTWLATGDSGPLEYARGEALRTGGITLAQNLDAVLALHDVLTGDFGAAEARLHAAVPACERLGLDAITRYVHVISAVLAAHQGDRAAMASALAAFTRIEGMVSPELPLARGMAQAVLELLSENRPAAEGHLAEVRRLGSVFDLAGEHGLALLVDVLAGRAGWEGYRQVLESPAAGMRWNRQFVALSQAVLLGRDGKGDEACQAFDEAAAAAEPFVTARHLGLRLVAEAALRDGWGEPATWLRDSEAYFRGAGLNAVARECRRLLRETGAARTRQADQAERIPVELQGLGLTAREFEVYQLLAQRLGNRALAGRLHLSPRTVEKYVASLMDKTGLQNRDEVADHAVTHLGAVMVFHGLAEN